MIKITYKLKDIKKQEAVRKLTGYDFDFFNNRSSSGKLECYPVETGTSCYNILNSLGLIDLWFEEVKEPFKVGDYVVLTADSYYSGEVLKVTDTSERGFGYYLNGRHCFEIGQDQFRYATEKEIKEYKTKKNLPKIGSYKPRINDPYISYGCVHIEKESLRQVLNAANILSMDIHADSKIITITKHELCQIKDYLNNQLK